MAIILGILSGLSYGSLLFLVASGLTLTIGLMRRVNLVHGSLYLIGGYLAFDLTRSGVNYWLALAVGIAVAGIVGLVIEVGLIQRVTHDILAQIVLTVGLGLVIQDQIFNRYGGSPVSSPIPSGLEGSVSVGALVFPKFRLAIIIAAPVVAAAIILTLRLTPVGAKVRASVDDVDVARVSGVRVPLLYMVVFGFGGLLAGFAGIWGGAFASLAPEDGFSFLFLAVVVIVLGGMGSISGALIAGLAIGLIEQFGRTYFPEWALFFMYGLSALVLVTRPQGLFGKEVRRQDA